MRTNVHFFESGGVTKYPVVGGSPKKVPSGNPSLDVLFHLSEKSTNQSYFQPFVQTLKFL